MLDSRVFLKLADTFQPLKVDLFAAYHNFQLQKYVSWQYDPLAVATDAFSSPGLWENGYAFPLFNLIGRCLQVVRIHQIQHLLLIAPVWPKQPWYPKLLDLLISRPRLLRCQVMDPQGNPHPMGSRLCLAAWLICGSPLKCEDFRHRLQTSGQLRGGNLPSRAMTVRGAAGVSHTKLIPFQDL